MYFSFFVITSPWKRMWPFIWRKMTSPYPRMLCVMFGCYCPNDSLIFVNIFSFYLYMYYLSLEKGVTLRLNRYRFPLPKEALSSVRQFGWNWSSGSGEEDVYISQCILAISISPSLGKGLGPSFEQTLHPQHPSWLNGSGEESDHVKSLQTDGRQETRNAHLSSQLSWNNRPTGLNGHLGIRNYTDLSPYS